MSYKFQRGEAILSGSIIIPSDTFEAKGLLSTDQVSGSGNLSIGGTVRLDGAADAAAVVGADSIYFFDATDNLMKKESMADYANSIAGDGLAASSGVLAVGVDDSTIELNSDALRLKDNGVTLAKLAGITRGSIIIGDSSGDPSLLAKGTAAQFLQSDGTDPSYVTISGDIAIAAGGAATIQDGAVESDMLADNIISGQAALGGATVDQADLLMIDDGPGTVKKVTFSNFEDSIFGNISGDATVAAGGALTIAADAVHATMLNDDVISGQTELAQGSLAAADEFLISDGGTIKRYGVDSLAKDALALTTEAAIADGDYIMFLDGGATGETKKESLADLAALFAGDGLAAASSVLAVQVSGAVKLASDKVSISGSIAGDALDFAGGVDSISAIHVVADESTIESAGKASLNVKAAGITETHLNASVAGLGLSGGGGSALAIDLNELTAEAIASGDFLAFVDSTDNGTHKETVDDLATLFAGNGLAASSAVLSLDLNELSAATVDVAADSIAIIDANDSNGSRKESIADLVTAMAAGVNGGLVADNGKLMVELSELATGGIAATDAIVFMDSNDSNVTKQDSVADLATLFAGVGLSAASDLLTNFRLLI